MKQALLAVVVSGFAMMACGGVDVPTSQDQDIHGVDDSADESDPSATAPVEGQSEGDTGEDGLSDDAGAPSGSESGEGATDPDEQAVTGGVFSNNSTVETTANLNLRSGPSTGSSVLRTMPSGSEVTVINGVASNGFIKVEHNGLQGYAAYRYLKQDTTSAAPATGGSSTATGGTSSIRDKAIAVAASGVGFSYWWGYGKWQTSGATSSNKGTCSGSCPSCSHSGANGADCSGFVAKVWTVPSSNTSISTNAHPYSTADFYTGTGGGQWKNVSKSAIKKADALVYRSGSAGHIVIYEKGDAWGSPWTYEARGCSYGIVHNIRSLSSSFKGIQRSSW